MPKYKSKSEAWRDLVKSHKRGPKRVRLHKKTKIEADETIKRVQLVVENRWNTNYFIVTMSGTTLNHLHMPKYRKLARNQSHDLSRTFTALDHNAIIMQESKTIPVRIESYCGPYSCEVEVVAGKLRNPSVTLHITNTKETIKELEEYEKYAESIFNRCSAKTVVVPVERM